MTWANVAGFAAGMLGGLAVAAAITFRDVIRWRREMRAELEAIELARALRISASHDARNPDAKRRGR